MPYEQWFSKKTRYEADKSLQIHTRGSGQGKRVPRPEKTPKNTFLKAPSPWQGSCHRGEDEKGGVVDASTLMEGQRFTGELLEALWMNLSEKKNSFNTISPSTLLLESFNYRYQNASCSNPQRSMRFPPVV